MANPWFKFYAGDYLNEVKLKGVDANKRSCFITALCYASQNGGVVDTRYMTNEQLKIEAGVKLGGEEWEEVGDIYEWMAAREFGSMEGHNFVFKNWDDRQAGPQTGYERIKKWREKNKDKTIEMNQNRRATVKGAEGSFTVEEWQKVKEDADFKCKSCGKQEPEVSLTVDHVVPVSKGGSNFISNIQPLCGKCNSAKGNRLYEGDNKLITTEEIREDKNREDKTRSRAYLLDLPPEHLKELSQKYEASTTQVKRKGEELSNYCLSKGKTYKNYRAFLEGALLRDFGRRVIIPAPKKEEPLDAEAQARLVELKKLYRPNFKVPSV